MQFISLVFVLILIYLASTHCAPAQLTLEEQKRLCILAGQPIEDERGLIYDFYQEKFQPAGSTVLPGEDLGEKFMNAVVKTAVVLGDVGIQTGQHILKSTGADLLEAVRMIK